MIFNNCLIWYYNNNLNSILNIYFFSLIFFSLISWTIQSFFVQIALPANLGLFSTLSLKIYSKYDFLLIISRFTILISSPNFTSELILNILAKVKGNKSTSFSPWKSRDIFIIFSFTLFIFYYYSRRYIITFMIIFQY